MKLFAYYIRQWLSPICNVTVQYTELSFQKRATKLAEKIKQFSYEVRLRKLKLPTLKYRRTRGDLIEVFKIGGNTCKLYLKQIKYDLRKYYFTIRTHTLWNSLPVFLQTWLMYLRIVLNICIIKIN